jgi:cytochrome b subunit of formate dehydrogenase
MSDASSAALAAPRRGAVPRVQRHYARFDRTDRLLHGFLMLSFLGLALSGLPLIVAEHGWARTLARLLGGFQSAMIVHRVCAAVLIAVFAIHVGRVVARAWRTRDWMAMLWGPTSMVPQPQDIVELWQNLRYFVGRGPRPQFDRYTYWEKFDYWAVFWGMFIIGGSGLLLWFPTFFTLFLPGWILNVATLVHGEEALLAVGFIFTIHFFNGHLRGEKFPMDTVIFTGVVSEHEMKDERGKEYARLAARGELAALESGPPSDAARLGGYLIGGTAVLVGIATIVLIVYSFL